MWSDTRQGNTIWRPAHSCTARFDCFVDLFGRISIVGSVPWVGAGMTKSRIAILVAGLTSPVDDPSTGEGALAARVAEPRIDPVHALGAAALDAREGLDRRRGLGAALARRAVVVRPDLDRSRRSWSRRSRSRRSWRSDVRRGNAICFPAQSSTARFDRFVDLFGRIINVGSVPRVGARRTKSGIAILDASVSVPVDDPSVGEGARAARVAEPGIDPVQALGAAARDAMVGPDRGRGLALARARGAVVVRPDLARSRARILRVLPADAGKKADAARDGRRRDGAEGR